VNRKRLYHSLAILALCALIPLLLLSHLLDLVSAAPLPALEPAPAGRAPADGVAVNSAPVLSPTAVLTIASVPEDTADPKGGTIQQMLADAGNPITDADAESPVGIAVIGADSAHGAWQYQVSAAGWKPFGVVSDTAAVLLNEAAFIRFIPYPDYAGLSGNLKIRAWDQTSGKNGDEGVDVSSYGGTTAFSQATNQIFTTVTLVNDAPVLDCGPATTLTYYENVDLPLCPGVTITDADSLIASATIELLDRPDGDAERLAVTVGDSELVPVYEEGVLKLTGAFDASVYESVLATVVYQNNSQEPDVSDRRIRLTVTDNPGSPSNTVERLLHVVSIDDPPFLDLDGIGPGLNFQTTFLINRGPAPIVAESLEVSDVDDTKIKSAEIRILNPGSKDGDVLRVTNFADDNITVIPYDIDTGILSLTGDDTIANYQRALRTATYDNIHKEPDITTREIQFTLTDFDNDLKSEPRLSTVTFEEAPPVLFYLPIVVPSYRRNEEPNNTCAQAMGLANNAEYTFQADASEDWYFFDLPTDSDVTVTLYNFAEGQIIIYGAGCGSADFIKNNGDNQPTKFIGLDTITAGRYYIRIIYDGETNVAPLYKLFVSVQPVP
jgi:hypothetical protein